jgi:hypothetical protein
MRYSRRPQSLALDTCLRFGESPLNQDLFAPLAGLLCLRAAFHHSLPFVPHSRLPASRQSGRIDFLSSLTLVASAQDGRADRMHVSQRGDCL